jgi:CspA family cold shock protein
MRTGKVKFFIESKGYGFITDEETGKDIFVHATGVKSENLREGDRVSYEEEEGRKGKVAAQVTAIDYKLYQNDLPRNAPPGAFFLPKPSLIYNQ